MKIAWRLLAIACLLAPSQGCVLRRGWVVKCDWTLEAHRTGCRHRWFHRRCCDCQTACEANPHESPPASSCQSCRAGGLFGQGEPAQQPAAPEPPGPATFHPVPTRPIYGKRAEEPDSYEAPMRPISPQPFGPDGLDMDGEPIDETDPAPVENDQPGPPQSDEAALRPRNRLRSPASSGSARHVSWQAADARMPSAVARRQRKSGTVRFRD